MISLFDKGSFDTRSTSVVKLGITRNRMIKTLVCCPHQRVQYTGFASVLYIYSKQYFSYIYNYRTREEKLEDKQLPRQTIHKTTNQSKRSPTKQSGHNHVI